MLHGLHATFLSTAYMKLNEGKASVVCTMIYLNDISSKRCQNKTIWQFNQSSLKVNKKIIKTTFKTHLWWVREKKSK